MSETDTPAPASVGFFVSIPAEPVSVNKAYASAGKRRVLTITEPLFPATIAAWRDLRGEQ